MKGLDTPVLLAILEGRPSARKLLRALEGEEVGTTEAQFLELGVIARRRGPGLEYRRQALERLRRGLTVLPLDHRAQEIGLSRWRPHSSGVETLDWLVFGALEANGCSEWVTSRARAIPRGPFKVKVSRVTL